MISRASESYTKTLFTRRMGELRPLLVKAEDEHMQSRFVAQRVLDLREDGVNLDDIAVLFRSSFHSFDLELELQRRDIPFVKRGGFKFIETAHIKDALAHLRVIANPVDAVSWLRVLLLLKGVGHRKAEQLIERVVASPDPAAELTGRAAAAKGGSIEGLARLAALLSRINGGEARPAQRLAAVLEYVCP